MRLEERKRIFAALLRVMLDEQGGIKNKLAENLLIKPSTLTPWLQGKVDPASLDIVTFDRLAQVKGCSTDELAILLKLKQKSSKTPLDRLRELVTEMLEGLSQEQLGRKLGISRNTIRGWLNPSKSIDPSQIPAGTIANLAQERGWTIERLLAYLGLKKFEEIEEELLITIKTSIAQLSVPNKMKLQSWFLLELENVLTNANRKIFDTNIISNFNDRTLIIILEPEDLAIGDTDLSLAQRATNYATNLAVNLELQPDNIQVASIENLPESIEEFDLLLFDISSSESEAIALIEEIEFDGNMIVFAPDDLPSKVMANLSDRVTDLVIKPINWTSLKDKEYFR